MLMSEKVDAEEEARSHIYLAKEWDNVLDTIRSTVPGFENFLLPPSCSTLLQNLPDSGWVIVINVHEDRSDALALRAGLDKPIHIELPSFSPEKADKLRQSLTKHLVGSKLRMREVIVDEDDERGCKPVGSRKGTVIRDVLAYLWKEVVKPILDALGLSSPRRRFWIIRGTTKEVRAIQMQVATTGVRQCILEGAAATVEDGLKEMEKYSCVHLACHAIQNKVEPLQSGFYFHDGALSLSRIIKKDLKHADLAFLSACQTSAGEEKLSEEAVHLAGGMLAAGYRGVVATMWSVRDQQAPQVAEDFYEYLLAEGGTGINGSRASYALHHAIQKLRTRCDNSESSLLTWVPYVHFGL
ncbi:hypothetical protein FA15DRAFT_661907 [Coprinopsis marcescibilis]|uniref:CHAT domain-containing protein n=1 Tax=Coprinopsis marcescibilis TaxID=230819 RepID=A0A5C3K9R0_COPMA|nr:hypothetical protein FA15DRAFT_661907 [Coprinopsis marcescibilis]